MTSPTQFLPVGDGAIAYDDVGNGPLVLCVPSVGDVRAEYRFLRPRLIEAGFRVVTMDLRGHGESSATFEDYTMPAIGQDITALVHHLNASWAAIIACAETASAVLWNLDRGPGIVDRIVLINPFLRARSRGRFQACLLNILLARPWGPALWTLSLPVLYPLRQPDDFGAYRSRLKTNLTEPGRIEAVRALMSEGATGIANASLASCTAPALIVMGTKDSDFENPAQEALRVADQVDGSICLVKGAGRYPHVEVPSEVGTRFVDFLDRSRVTASSTAPPSTSARSTRR